jgi:hypothetical protein
MTCIPFVNGARPARCDATRSTLAPLPGVGKLLHQPLLAQGPARCPPAPQRLGRNQTAADCRVAPGAGVGDSPDGSGEEDGVVDHEGVH